MVSVRSFFEEFEMGDLQDAFIPIFLLVAVILINSVFPEFAIGMPPETLSQEGKFLTRAVVAPIAEELIFRVLVLGGADLFFGIFSIPLQAAIFALMHWQVYGLGMQAAFIGAGSIGLMLGFYMWSKKTFWALVGVMAFHGGFNLWLTIVRNLVIGA